MNKLAQIGPGPLDRFPELRARYGSLDGEDLLRVMVHDVFPERIAVLSSFGAESAVLLHMVAQVNPDVPVLFIDTRRHFPETLRYRDTVAAKLGLTDVRSIGPTADEVAAKDPNGFLASQDADACCAFRKVAVLDKATRGFDALITGRKRHHGGGRADLPSISHNGIHTQVNPLVRWDAEEVEAMAEALDLPRHPMVADGFDSIGCMPCTVRATDGARSGRWAGSEKTECGIHKSPWF